YLGVKIERDADIINTYTLVDMYFHGFITASPYRDITLLNFQGYDNLNELNIEKVIKFVDEILTQIGK
ncbi:MAG: hypothetical protein K2J30_01590, partial [Clostridia bacterium]|nr:hypothetical protein [Clostridia bacterium]